MASLEDALLVGALGLLVIIMAATAMVIASGGLPVLLGALIGAAFGLGAVLIGVGLGL
jgi:hypothetical protein